MNTIAHLSFILCNNFNSVILIEGLCGTVLGMTHVSQKGFLKITVFHPYLGQ